MSNTIAVSVSSTVTFGAGGGINGVGSFTLTQVGTDNIGNVQSVGTTTEALTLGDVTTIGYLFLKNQDATNYVEISLTTPVGSEAFIKLLAGECAFFPTRQTTIYAKANTAAVDLFVAAFEL